MEKLRIAVIGHAEHITIGRVPAVPRTGEIAHLQEPRSFAGGGGGVAFAQLVKSSADIDFFTALGSDDAAAEVERQLAATRGRIHAARRTDRHTRDVVLVTPDGERTIVVAGEPLHPRRADPLPWEALAACDAAYFTAQDPQALVAARAARILLVTARRRAALVASGVRADVVVGSANDAREATSLLDYPVPPGALVMTEGAAGGRVETASGTVRFAAPASAPSGGGAYGSGDSFAAALVYYLAAGADVVEACRRAAPHGAAVLGGLDPWATQLALP
jgi:ribokinase